MFLNPAENDLRTIVQSIRELWQGRGYASGQVTLRTSQTTTTVTDQNVGDKSRIQLTPRTANAAGALATTYISSQTRGSFVITHASAATADRTFDYVFLG